MEFIKRQLANLAADLKKNQKEFINDFMSFSSDSRFTAENAKKIIEFLTAPQNHKISSTELVEGLKVNIDWTVLKDEKEVFPEAHHRFHDIHIPTFAEGMFISSAATTLPVKTEFDETKDIGFYVKSADTFASKIAKNSWKFIPVGVYHGPLYGGFETSSENYCLENNKKRVVKICIKILAD